MPDSIEPTLVMVNAVINLATVGILTRAIRDLRRLTDTVEHEVEARDRRRRNGADQEDGA